jgi:hypothetical protein
VTADATRSRTEAVADAVVLLSQAIQCRDALVTTFSRARRHLQTRGAKGFGGCSKLGQTSILAAPDQRPGLRN